MEKYFSIGEAAKAVHTTTETLRHYDRIGLVKPGKKDEWTNYRYYTEQDIVRLCNLVNNPAYVHLEDSGINAAIPILESVGVA